MKFFVRPHAVCEDGWGLLLIVHILQSQEGIRLVRYDVCVLDAFLHPLAIGTERKVDAQTASKHHLLGLSVIFPNRHLGCIIPFESLLGLVVWEGDRIVLPAYVSLYLWMLGIAVGEHSQFRNVRLLVLPIVARAKVFDDLSGELHQIITSLHRVHLAQRGR